MAYTTIDKPSDYFNTILWSGNSSTNALTGVGFQPDWVWVKERSSISNHQTYDAVRGTTKQLEPNTTGAEGTISTGITSFDTDGFTVGNNADLNSSGETYVGWNWLASNTTASNTDGSISSTVSANTTSGFSIVSYTGNGTDGATVGHGLTSPKLVLIKDRDNATPWLMYGYPNHPAFPNDGSLIKLNESSAMVTDDLTTELSIGSSTVTFVDAGSAINANSTNFIMYCFQEKQGYSKFGSYVGNGSTDGTFVYTGMKPSFVMAKNTQQNENWLMWDNKRSEYNQTQKYLTANGSGAEDDSVNYSIDMLSNGFKLRTSTLSINGSGNSIIFMAFAENPFVSSTGVPATAK